MPDTARPQEKRPETHPPVPTRPEAEPAFERAREAAPAPAAESERPLSVVMPPTPAPAAAATPAGDVLARRIESILEEDLSDVYFKMSPAEQAVFKKKGEEATAKIKTLLQKANVAAKDILQVIIAWLRSIPGVNRFFLEQEAKIKTDKILAIKK